MGFTLKDLSLKGFRNHADLRLDGLSPNVVIIGPNAVGKSNIIEAIQLLSVLESFRTSKWPDLQRNGIETCHLKGLFTDGERQLEVELAVVEGKRRYLFNGKPRALGDAAEQLAAVLFTPDDLDIVKGPPEQRRLALDNIGKKVSKQYAKAFSDYQKTLRQRNSLLKDVQKSHVFPDTPTAEETAWSERLAEQGAQLTVLRYRLFLTVSEKSANHYRSISGGEELGMVYTPSFEQSNDDWDPSIWPTTDIPAVKDALLKALALRRLEELARGVSLVGPQRDDISFQINGDDARSFASQGQQRSVALALKLAEVDILGQQRGGDVILLLDDVLSELDETRRQRLLELSGQVAQSFITSTDLRFIPAGYLQSASLIQL